MTYRLVNIQTGEVCLCEKITMDGFDYYLSNEKPYSV